MKKAIALVSLFAGIAVAQPALAQEDSSGTNDSTFRGIRIEGDIGGDRFQSEGIHNDRLGYGATVGFDGTISERIVVGAEGTYWRASEWTENCHTVGVSASCRKSFDEFGVAVRAGVLLSPQLLVFGKGGYVNNEQRRRVNGPTGATLLYDHYRSDGYQLGGGVEFDLTRFGSMPVFVNTQYVYSRYNDHTSRHRVTAGIGIRFK